MQKPEQSDICKMGKSKRKQRLHTGGQQISNTQIRNKDGTSRLHVPKSIRTCKTPSTYDENFIVAEIDVIKETLQIIRKRGRPKKLNNNKTQRNTKTTHNDSYDIKTNTMESSNDSNKSLNCQTKRQRGRPRKANVELSNDSTLTKYNTDKCGTTTNKSLKNRK